MSTPVFSSYIRRKDMDSVLSCLVTDSIGPGETYARFVSAFAEFAGAEYVAAFRSPVTALVSALQCLALEPDSGVIVSAAAPSYYAYAIRQAGLRLMIADVDLVTGAIMPESVAELASKGARAIIVGDSFGIMADFPRLLEAGLPIIEDISSTMGAFIDTRKAGDSGTLVFFSLESGGVLTSGEGAVLFAKGKREAAAVRSLFEGLPRELKLSDMNSSLGLAQLKEFSRFQERRKELYSTYQRSLMQSRHKMLTQLGEGELAYFAFPVILESGIKDVRAYAKKKDIDTLEAFADTLIATEALAEGECPNARSLSLRTILFPLNPRVSGSLGQKIVKVLATLP